MPDGQISFGFPDSAAFSMGETQQNRVRGSGNFARRFKRLRRAGPHGAKISLYENQKIWINYRRPAPTKRGASRSSRTLGAGCDGRFGIN
jgi:hypothetical protein